jgi:hypothetical protein
MLQILVSLQREHNRKLLLNFTHPHHYPAGQYLLKVRT